MRTMIFALVLVLSSNLAIAVEPGVYSCETELIVGIWPEREATPEEDFDYSNIPRQGGIVHPVLTKDKSRFVA